jgi:EmrB/QacA subfamily drug resistance transporter
LSTTVPAPCDAALAATSGAHPSPHAGLTLAASVLASSLAFVDGSVVNVALPTIGRALAADAAGKQWILNAYLLPLSALLLLGGAAGDGYGRRRVFLLGIAAFTAGSATCAAAPSLGVLLAGRALQGVGAAMLTPNSLALLGSAFSGEARGRAIGTWAAAGAVAGALGPVAGGWLMDTVGWRTIFLVNLPVAAGAMLLGARYVSESASEARARIDWLGGGLATMSLGALTWALTLATGGVGHRAEAALAAVAGALALILFVVVESRSGDGAMMPLALFATATSIGVTLLTFTLYAALSGLLVLLPYLLIVRGGYNAVTAGAALMPLPAVLGLTSRAMGRTAGRMGSRLPLTVGPLVVAAGFVLATRIDGTASYWTTTFPAVLVVAIGMAGAVAPLTTAVMSSVDAHHVGVANGFNSAVARTGGLTATAALGTVLAARGEALVSAFRVAAWIGAGAALLASLAAAALIERSPTRDAW